MKVETLNLESGHGVGLCALDITYPNDGLGSIAVTGGADATLTVHDIALKKVLKSEELEQEVHAIAVSPDGKTTAVGGGDYVVRLFSLPDLEFMESPTRFTARVRGVAFTPDGTMLAAWGEEPGLRVMRKTASGTWKMAVLGDDGDGGVKAASWHPSGNMIASLGFDGDVKVWNISPDLEELTCDCETKLANCVPHEAAAPADATTGEEWCRPDRVQWSADGEFLSVPGNTSVRLLKKGTWETSYITGPADDSHSSPICNSCWSKDGKYIVTACMGGRLVLWDIKAGNSMYAWEALPGTSSSPVFSGIRWLPGPDGGTLLVQTMDGYLGCIQPVIPQTVLAQKTAPSSTIGAGSKAPGPAEEGGGGVLPPAGGEKSKSSGATKKLRLIDDQAAEAGDGDDDVSDAGNDVDGEHGMRDGDADMGAGGARQRSDSWISTDDVGNANGTSGAGPVVIKEYGTPPQPAFQPSSTPKKERRRFLCWNSYGSVTSVDEGEHNSIAAEFTDSRAGRPQRFRDQWKFSIGTIGPCGTACATMPENAHSLDDGSEDDADDNVRSVIYFQNANGPTWDRILRAKEVAQCIAAGDDWIAVASSKNNLIIFTCSGLQIGNFRLPGAPVAMAASGPLLAVIYHSAAPANKSQNLSYWLVRVGTGERVACGAVGLTPHSLLTWVGFSSEKMLCIMDSAGAVSGLTPAFGWSFTTLLQSRYAGVGAIEGGRGPALWPVHITNNTLSAVQLRGGEKIPTTLPRPVLVQMELAVPVARSRDKKTEKFEATLLVSQSIQRQRKAMLRLGIIPGGGTLEDEDSDDEREREQAAAKEQVAIDSEILKAFGEAVSKKLSIRAMDLARCLYLEKAYIIAIKVANNKGLAPLAAAIEKLQIAKFSKPESNNINAYDSDEGGMGGGGYGRQNTLSPRRGGRDETDSWQRALKSRDNSSMHTGGSGVLSGGSSARLGPLGKLREQEKMERESMQDSTQQTGNMDWETNDTYDAPDYDKQESKTTRYSGGDAGAESGTDNDHPEEYVGGGQDEVEDMDTNELVQDNEIVQDRVPGAGAAAGSPGSPPPRAVPRNPFASSIASPNRRKRQQGVFESLSGILGSPSPAKKPALGRSSAFASKARSSTSTAGGKKSSKAKKDKASKK